MSVHSPLANSVKFFIPNLCYLLKIPCPSFFSEPAMSFTELEAYISEAQRKYKKSLFSERWSKTKMPTGEWDELFLEQMTVSDDKTKWTGSSPEKARLLVDLLRLACKSGREQQNWQEILKWLAIFERVSPIFKPDYHWCVADYIEADLLSIGILTHLHFGDMENVDRYIRIKASHDLGFLNFPKAAERIAKGLLEDVTQVSQEQAQTFLAAIDKKNEVSISGFVPQVEDWKELLEELTTTTEEPSFLKAGATEEEIAELERRLNTTLPLSYKNFLRASNGFVGYPLNDLYGTDQIKWFIEESERADFIDSIDEEDESDDEEYFLYGEHQDTLSTRERYMATALQISNDEDGNVYLLNPEIIDARNEWEAWDYSDQLVGAIRYRSFWEMVKETD
ncbi:MAG: SMI1/KNR4 family protein [Thiotrichaceae bacterium]|nr:SMI1/KNR4 family protein [Thiotrichaceae bacterium]